VRDRPEDVPLRLHLAELLLDAGEEADAIAHVAQALQRDPDSPVARALMGRAIGATAIPLDPPLSLDPPVPVDPAPRDIGLPLDIPPPGGSGSVDWRALEEELSDVVPPRFARADAEPDPILGEADRAFDVETCTIRLADVGGMADVKRRLELAFLGPLRNPQLRAMYGKSLRRGLLLYGPPGC